MDYPTASRRIEDLPSDGGKIVDTLAGALLRLFVRLNEIDSTLGRHDRRIGALEGRRHPPPVSSAAEGPLRDRRAQTPPEPVSPIQQASEGSAPAFARGAKRRAGRPPGSKNKPKPNGYHDDDGGDLDPERDLSL